MLRKPCWSAHWIAARTVSGAGWWRNAAMAEVLPKPCRSAQSITPAISSRAVLFSGLFRPMAHGSDTGRGHCQKWRRIA